MRLTTYGKYLPQLADAVNLQDLLDKLSDFLLQSGFAGGPSWHPYWGEFGDEDTRSLDALKQAIVQALKESGQLTPDMLKVLRGESSGDERRDAEIRQQLAELIDQVVQRLIDDGYLNVQQAPRVPQGHQPMFGPGGQAQSEPHIIHQMEKAAPDKTFIGVPGGDGECNCNMCPYMALNTLEKLYVSLRDLEPRIELDPAVMDAARVPLQRMLDMAGHTVGQGDVGKPKISGD